jgi:hypothetical protein
MTDALDKGYNEGRLAFRRYFAKFGPNVKQNDPRMPPNPYVRIPTKPATHSNRKPATDSDLKPAGVPI